MPIYEYRCESCNHELERMQKLSDPPLRDCPSCGEPALKKLISAAGFRLKGGGWYETDFKKTNRKNLHESGEKPAGGDKKETKSGDSGSTAKGAPEKKPAAASKPAEKKSAA